MTAERRPSTDTYTIRVATESLNDPHFERHAVDFSVSDRTFEFCWVDGRTVVTRAIPISDIEEIRINRNEKEKDA